MGRFIKILAIFFLGAGTSLLIQNSLVRNNSSITKKPLEITKEATSTTPLNSTVQEIVTVKRVIDGDTVELGDGRRVRYIGIDTPEVVDPRKSVECFGREAKEENKRRVEGKTVRLEKDISEKDNYGRLLRYVYIADLMVNDYLARQGFAHASTYPPDVKYQERFLEAEREARENNRGLWSGCQDNPTNPTPLRQGSTGQANITITPAVQGAQSGCVIKGNISSTGEKIYHTPGCGSYEKTVIDESVGERWFCSEEEAVSAGWRKAKNC